MDLLKDFLAFIQERERVRVNRLAGKSPDRWTSDPILRQYRFCNVRREDDRVTSWVRENWRNPTGSDPDLWFAMLVARLFNNEPTLDELTAAVVPMVFGVGRGAVLWSPELARRILSDRREKGLRNFSAAYMIHAGPTEGLFKHDYLINEVLNPAWEKREEIRPCRDDSLATFHRRLMSLHDLGSFMAAQVVADTKHCGTLRTVADWDTWAAVGPGSARGLNRVLGRDPATKWKEGVWWPVLNQLREEVLKDKKTQKLIGPIDAQDVQNCLCEFDKYCRARNGEGRPKQNFAPKNPAQQEIL